MSMADSPGLLVFSSATASGTPLLHPQSGPAQLNSQADQLLCSMMQSQAAGVCSDCARMVRLQLQVAEVHADTAVPAGGLVGQKAEWGEGEGHLT